MYGFIFRDEESTDYGIVCDDPVKIPAGKIRSETIKIVGSSKVLHYTEGPYVMDPVTVSINCALVRPDEDAIQAACAFLRGGGDLVIPGLEERSFRAWVKNQISFDKVIRQRGDRRFTVEFECDPFKYFYPAPGALDIAQGTVRNPGTAPAEPLIAVYGSGDITLIVGDSTLMIEDVVDYVYIDCEAQVVYKELVNWGDKTTRSGDWPVIDVGGSAVSWSGSVTKVTLLRPRWRDV